MPTTLNQFIKSEQSNTVHTKDFFYKGVLTDDTTRLYVLDDSILIPYDTELNKYKVRRVLTDEELRKYKCNPWRVAQDVYGSPEYWFLVLHANEMYSASEFTRKYIHMYTTKVIPVITEILAVEDKNIRSNQNEVNRFMKGQPSKLNLI